MQITIQYQERNNQAKRLWTSNTRPPRKRSVAGRSNVQHRILNKVFYQFINWRSDPSDPPERDPPASPEGEADGGQATKIQRALSTARDGGQDRFHYSMFTRLRRRQRRPGFNVRCSKNALLCR